jgi:uncharacterized repeat protein (TIGR01451 family)
MATVEVLCAELSISKTADHQAPVELGSQIGFTVTVTNAATATANDLHVSDALDARFSWSIESQTGALTWTLAGNQLAATGDLPTGSSSVHVVATTPLTDTEEHCGLVPNTAFLTQGTARARRRSATPPRPRACCAPRSASSIRAANATRTRRTSSTTCRSSTCRARRR